MAQVRIRKRGKTFSYAFEAGIINGKRKVVEKGGFLSKSEAYKAGAEAYTDFLHGNIGIVSESVTLRVFMGRWLDNVVALNVRASSMQTYRSRFEKQIAPYLGEVKVQEITPALLDDWIRRLLKAGLSRNTLLAVHALLCGALNYAVHPSQLISSNPATYIKVPKNAPRNVIARHIITPEQFNALLGENPFGSSLYIPLLILYHTGMRISEVLGLTWQDINFQNKQITLNRQFIHLNNQGYFFAPLKTETSSRCILINDINSFLWTYIKACNNAAIANNFSPQKTCLCRQGADKKIACLRKSLCL